jgi:acyl-CoA reductase-like NAD-dependent aldehyde dehydrogenase
LLEGLTSPPSPPPAPPPPAPARVRLAEKAPSQAPGKPERAAEPAHTAPEVPRVLGATAGNPVPAPQAASDGRHWARIELDLRAAVLREISEQLPREVEAIVQMRMLESIDRLITGLAAETRKAVAASMRDIVERAVHAELERLRKSSKG